VQTNVVGCQYDVQRLEPGARCDRDASRTPDVLAGLLAGHHRDVANTTGAPAAGVNLSISVPKQWTSVVPGTTQTSVTIDGPGSAGCEA